MRKYVTASLLAIAAAGLYRPAIAQDDRNADIVVTANGIAQPRDQVGQAISVIDADKIDRLQQDSVIDLLTTLPSVRFNRNGGPGSTTGVSLRGAETTQTLVLIDGVKVNDTAGIGDMFDFGNLLTGNIRRIEVLNGSNSVAYGSQAIGGVVNILTATPTTGIEGRGSLEYGYRDTFEGKLSLSGGSDRVQAGAGVSYFRTDGISAVSAPNDGPAERDGYRNLSANARLNVALTDDIGIDLRGYYIHGDLQYDNTFGASFWNAPVSALSDQYVGYAGLNVALFDGALKNRFSLTYTELDRTYYSAANAPARDSGFYGGNLRFEYQGQAQPIDRVKLVFGYEHEAPEFYSYNNVFVSNATARANLDNIYGIAILDVARGLTVTGGVRYTDHSQFGGKTTFGANANWTFNQGRTSLRASYGEGFKAPSLYQLYDSFSGNAGLRPEESDSYDIGLDQTLVDGLARFSFTLFQRDIRNQIDYDTSIGIFGAYNNIARTRARGVETTLTVKPVDRLSVDLAYSLIDARNRSPGSINFDRRLPRRAESSGSLSVDYDWSFGLSTGFTVTAVDDSLNSPDTAFGNGVRLQDYALVGIRAAFKLSDRIELFGRIDNLTDARYATAVVSATNPYGTYGRSAYAGVRGRF